MVRPSRWFLVLAAVLAAPAARAQTTRFFLPPSAVLTNYDRVLIGQEEALESGAFVARVADSTAGWYNPASLAARFAAKEAVAKALGTGLGEISFTEIEIIRGASGEPLLHLHGDALAAAEKLGLREWAISLSHTQEQAVASVVASG